MESVIPTKIIIHKETLVHQICQGCSNLITKAPWVSNGDDCYCTKCSRERMETWIAAIKFYSSELTNLMNDYFPKAKKDKPSDINITSTF